MEKRVYFNLQKDFFSQTWQEEGGEKKNRYCMIFRCACMLLSVVVSLPEDDEEA